MKFVPSMLEPTDPLLSIPSLVSDRIATIFRAFRALNTTDRDYAGVCGRVTASSTELKKKTRDQQLLEPTKNNAASIVSPSLIGSLLYSLLLPPRTPRAGLSDWDVMIPAGRERCQPTVTCSCEVTQTRGVWLRIRVYTLVGSLGSGGFLYRTSNIARPQTAGTTTIVTKTLSGILESIFLLSRECIPRQHHGATIALERGSDRVCYSFANSL